MAIYLSHKGKNTQVINFSSRYYRWNELFRINLFANVQYAKVSNMSFQNSIPKIANLVEQTIWEKLHKFSVLKKHYFALLHKSYSTVYFHNAPRYWIRAMNFEPYFWNERDGQKLSTQVKSLRFGEELDGKVMVSVLSSSLFFWWFLILSDCRHLNQREIDNFPIGLEKMSPNTKTKLAWLSDDFIADLRRNAFRKEAYYKATGKVVYDEFYPKHSKSLIDQIDTVLAQHYGFIDEELDFIINYDIKYRLGSTLTEEDEE